MVKDDRFKQYLDTEKKEHPGSTFVFSLLRKIDKPYYKELVTEILTQRAEHGPSQTKDGKVSEEAKTIFENSLVRSRNRRGKLASNILTTKKIAYKAKNKPWTQEGKKVNVRQKIAQRNRPDGNQINNDNNIGNIMNDENQ